ncbi:NUDIX hydrolase [[Anoxybacillus] calidus]
MVQRGDIVWNFPCGGVKPDETLEEACVREVFEGSYVMEIVK